MTPIARQEEHTSVSVSLSLATACFPLDLRVNRRSSSALKSIRRTIFAVKVSCSPWLHSFRALHASPVKVSVMSVG